MSSPDSPGVIRLAFAGILFIVGCLIAKMMGVNHHHKCVRESAPVHYSATAR